MKAKGKVRSLQNYRRYALKAQILDDIQMMSWFADVCAGKSPEAKVSEETLALMEGHGLVRKTDFGWVLGAEGRQFARELELIPGPSKFEINPSLINKDVPKNGAEQSALDNSMLSIEESSKTDQKQDIDQIWDQFHKTRDDYYRNLLMEYYRGLVVHCAERLRRKLPDKVELDDLISAGIFGLIDAIDAFDPTEGAKFETYCSIRIRDSILDELRSMDWVPRLVRARAHQLEKATHSLETNLGRIPTEKEIAEELDMDMEEFSRLQRDANAARFASSESAFDESKTEENNNEIEEIKVKEIKDSLIEAQKRYLKSFLTKGLTRQERLIIVLYYYEECTMKEIAATLDMSESRVSQIHSSIVARLKSQMRARKEEFPIQ